MTAASFGHLYARHYDTFYSDKPYEAEAERALELLDLDVQSGPAILDVACGTGSHALAFARKGLRVTGVDASQPMIARARQKAASVGLAATFEQKDMRMLEPSMGRFDGAVCLFDAIGYVGDEEAVVEGLRAIASILAPPGAFLVEFWHAPAVQKGLDAFRARRWETGDGLLIRVSETALTANNVARVTYTIFDPTPDGSYDMAHEDHDIRYFEIDEMAGYMKAAGFEELAFFDGFGTDPATSETWHVLALGRLS